MQLCFNLKKNYPGLIGEPLAAASRSERVNSSMNRTQADHLSLIYWQQDTRFPIIWNTAFFDNVVNQISHPPCTKTTRCLLHLTHYTSRTSCFSNFKPLIAVATSSEMRQQDPITSGQSTSPSQSFSTFRSISICFFIQHTLMTCLPSLIIILI